MSNNIQKKMHDTHNLQTAQQYAKYAQNNKRYMKWNMQTNMQNLSNNISENIFKDVKNANKYAK